MFCLHVCTCSTCMQCPRKLDEDSGSSGTGVRASCELPRGWWEWNLGGAARALDPEPPSQPIYRASNTDPFVRNADSQHLFLYVPSGSLPRPILWGKAYSRPSLLHPKLLILLSFFSKCFCLPLNFFLEMGA